MKRYVVTNIQWDCDTEEERADLPSIMVVCDEDNSRPDDEVAEYLSDTITNQSGYCHDGFNYERIQVLEKKDIAKIVGELKNEETVTLYAIENDANPNIVMGVERHKSFNGVSVFLCGSSEIFSDIKCVTYSVNKPPFEVFEEVADVLLEIANSIATNGIMCFSQNNIKTYS